MGSPSSPSDYGGRQKTRLIFELAVADASDGLVRLTSAACMRGASRDDHVERLDRLHRFMCALDYHREPIEMIQHSAMTLRYGGDCDCHARVFGALAWSLRYPFFVESIGASEGPEHYTMRLGYPPAESPRGDRSTTWRCYETTIRALPGEHVYHAQRRLFR